MANERGFYCSITKDRSDDLQKFLKYLIKFNKYPVFVAVAENHLDAYRKKTQIGSLSPFNTTVYLDTDILVNGNLDFLFENADKGFVCVARHLQPQAPPAEFNAGVLAINKENAVKLSELWTPAYDKKIIKAKGCFDQDILNKLLPKFNVFPLPSSYNYITKEHTLEEEERDFPNIKIFHFLHSQATLYKDRRSWRIYHGKFY